MEIEKQLDDLFKHWSKEPRFSDGNFFIDGVINEEVYSTQSEKILFIAKEPNHANHQEAGKNFRKEWNEKIPDYRMAKQIAQWSHAIHNNFPPFNKVKTNVDDLRRIAFMNIKKSSGGGSSDYSVFKDYLSEDNHLRFIQKEIEIINPTLIILGITWWRLRNKIFPSVKWQDSGYGILYGKNDICTIIDFYHPSSRIPSNATYCLLEKIFTRIK